MEFLSSDLVREQTSIVHRRQLRAAGVTVSSTIARLRSGNWQQLGPVVIATHNGPLTPSQRRWAVLLNGGRRAALGGLTALELAGLKGWEVDEVHLLVPKGVTPSAISGVPVVVHQTRRDAPGQLQIIGCPARTPVERSAIDAASWSSSSRSCAGLLAAVVQQRLSTAPKLLKALEAGGRVHRARLMRLTLDDIDGGAHALTEIDFGRMCRKYGLMVTARQVVRLDAQGKRRYLDGVITDGSGAQVAFEVDGALHLAVRSYWADMDRSNELVIAGQTLLRFPSVVVRTEERRVVDQLQRALSNAASASYDARASSHPDARKSSGR